MSCVTTAIMVTKSIVVAIANQTSFNCHLRFLLALLSSGVCVRIFLEKEPSSSEANVIVVQHHKRQPLCPRVFFQTTKKPLATIVPCQCRNTTMPLPLDKGFLHYCLHPQSQATVLQEDPISDLMLMLRFCVNDLAVVLCCVVLGGVRS